MHTDTLRNEEVAFHEIDNREIIDQLLKLLGENQVFLNKIQHGQWNFNLFAPEEYSTIVNLLFNCGEKIAAQLKLYNGFVPAYMEVYLGVSEITEELERHSKAHVIQGILFSHRSLMNYLISFFNDGIQEEGSDQAMLIDFLYTTHSTIFQILQDWCS